MKEGHTVLSMAPMEGATWAMFRRVHAEVFGPLDRYYTPFVSPPPKVGDGSARRFARELDPARNQGLDVVPQLLTSDADRFVWAAGLLRQMGCKEVNLNAGCPSGTVVSKGKGSGLLRDPVRLETFLRDVCERSPLPVSVKTRTGMTDDSEFDEILDVYRRLFPAELIVHPRVQKDFYKGLPRRELYGEALERAPFPVAYNGDVFAPGDLEALLGAYPAAHGVEKMAVSSKIDGCSYQIQRRRNMHVRELSRKPAKRLKGPGAFMKQNPDARPMAVGDRHLSVGQFLRARPGCSGAGVSVALEPLCSAFTRVPSHQAFKAAMPPRGLARDPHRGHRV